IGPPKVHPQNRLITAEEGDQIKLPCPISGNPDPLFEWKKDGKALHKSENTYEDPEILQGTNTTVTEGGNTTLQCLVRSFLIPEIQWLKLLAPSEVTALPRSLRNTTFNHGGRTYRYISSLKFRVERKNGTYVSTLFIEKAATKDTGVYICVGESPNIRKYNIRRDSEMNLLVIILPIIAILVIVFVTLFICKTRRVAALEKPHPSTAAQNTSVESEDPTSNTPLNSYKHSKAVGNLPPDIVYQ
ncbi:Fibroblast growth factor receptor-like 1, partial [Armadillidium nasatum]